MLDEKSHAKALRRQCNAAEAILGWEQAIKSRLFEMAIGRERCGNLATLH
jgi:hypothetical protein